ncbi:prepilin-type N-terminal cleavage/methylation domain-containing protein [Sphingomonas sp. dw_22]|uniref:type II secretion system protein n=1 Tax=Sphingomonas sp. dw_22 TaxID=2721175 RepID=UPI001BD43CD4|nr:prepilin-type N-terminal cleavage/methylation domain-containing protein [Sphingomonas sp. dw_22]
MGFTLIEVLVSLALMGMAAALLLSGLRMAGLVAMHERTTGSGLDEVIAAQRVLRTGIERLRPIARVDTSGSVVEFRGNDAVLSYVAPPLERQSPNALQRFRLARATSGDLVLYSVSTRQARIDPSGFDLVGWTPTTLLRGTSNLSISYRGAPVTGGPRTWLNEWWDRGKPPELIRIRVEFPAGDSRQWPDLLVRPRATTTTTCQVDGTTNGRCGERP